jgi:hypothetical protein
MTKLLVSLLFIALTLTTHAKEKPLEKMTLTDVSGKTYNVTGTEQGLKFKDLKEK